MENETKETLWQHLEVVEDERNNLLIVNKELLEACKEAQEAIDILFAMLIESKEGFYPSKSGKPWKAINLLQQAIKQATLDK